MKRSNSPDLKDCNTNGQIGSAKYFTRLAESIFGSDPITQHKAKWRARLPNVKNLSINLLILAGIDTKGQI